MEVQRVLLQFLPRPPTVEQSQTEKGSPSLLSHCSTPFHLHCKYVLKQHHAGRQSARLTYNKKAAHHLMNNVKRPDSTSSRHRCSTGAVVC